MATTAEKHCHNFTHGNNSTFPWFVRELEDLRMVRVSFVKVEEYTSSDFGNLSRTHTQQTQTRLKRNRDSFFLLIPN